MKADINKQNKQTQKAKEKRTLDSLSPMERGMKDLLKELFKPNKEFDEKKFFQIVTDYVNNYDRLLYSELSSRCFNLNPAQIESIQMNISSAVEYAYSNKIQDDGKKELVQRTKRSILKLYDHFNLATAQRELARTDDSIVNIVDKKVSPFKEELMKDMSSQLITLVGIFTAIAFVVFGGITSLSSVFSSINNTPVSKIIMLALLWGISISNCIYVLLYCIGILTKNKSSILFGEGKIPLWSNLILITLFLLSAWFYYISSRNIDQWFVQFRENYQIFISIFGFIFILGLSFLAGFFIRKRTKKKTSSRD